MAITASRPGRAEARIIASGDPGALDEIRRADVQAVIWTRGADRRWLTALGDQVCAGHFRVPRIRLHDVDRAGLAGWLRDTVASGGLEPNVESSLTQDVLWLADRLTALTCTDRYTLRIFTEPPSTECGFHVDTVVPGAVPIGLLAVYNGQGTTYVLPDNISGMADFYRYLRRRDRLVRERLRARQDNERSEAERIERDIALLDSRPDFLLPSGDVDVAPAQTVVAFKHLDARLHWSDRAEPTAWIHCSPMAGEARLVVNLTPSRPSSLSARRAAARNAVGVTHPPR